MNKPRIRKFKGLWYCGWERSSWISQIGVGYTPESAYLDWYRYQAKA